MIDIVLILLIVVLSFKGYFNGAIRELVGFIGLIGGVFVASRAADPVAHMIHNSIHMGNMALLKLLGFLIVLVIIWGGSAFVATIFTSLRSAPHSTLSKLLGMGLAGLKYFLIFALISASLLGTNLIRDNFGQGIRSSRLLPILNQTGSTLINLSPLSTSSKKSIIMHKPGKDT
jgi:membrane protein required for colicin V production